MNSYYFTPSEMTRSFEDSCKEKSSQWINEFRSPLKKTQRPIIQILIKPIAYFPTKTFETTTHEPSGCVFIRSKTVRNSLDTEFDNFCKTSKQKMPLINGL